MWMPLNILYLFYVRWAIAIGYNFFMARDFINIVLSIYHRSLSEVNIWTFFLHKSLMDISDTRSANDGKFDHLTILNCKWCNVPFITFFQTRYLALWSWWKKRAITNDEDRSFRKASLNPRLGAVLNADHNHFDHHRGADHNRIQRN